MQFCRGTSGVLGLTLLVATNGLGDDPDHVLILRLEVYVPWLRHGNILILITFDM